MLFASLPGGSNYILEVLYRQTGEKSRKKSQAVGSHFKERLMDAQTPSGFLEINISQTIRQPFRKHPGLEYGHNLKAKEINMKDKEFVVEKIRSQYTQTEYTDLDALKALDAKVKKPANVFGYTYGSIGAIVMGAGMSLVMTDIGAMLGITKTMVPGITVGIVGLVMVLTTYPICRKLLASRKKKYAPQILELSERVMKG